MSVEWNGLWRDLKDYIDTRDWNGTLSKPSESDVDDRFSIRVNMSNGTITRCNLQTGKVLNFNKLDPWARMRRCLLNKSGEVVAYYGDKDFTETSDYPVMVEIPKFYYKAECTDYDTVSCLTTYGYKNASNAQAYSSKSVDLKGASIITYTISTKPYPDLYVHPAFLVYDNTSNPNDYREIDNIYVGAYLNSIDGGNTFKNISRKGAKLTGYSKSNITSYINSNTNSNPNWKLMHYNTYAAIQMLFLFEYLSFDSRSIIGKGIFSSSWKNNAYILNGITSDLGNISGKAVFDSNNTTYGMQEAVNYRGIENLWGITKQAINGAYIVNNRIVINKNNTNYVDGNDTNIYNMVNCVDYLSYGNSYSIANVSQPAIIDSLDGFINKFSYLSDMPYLFFPQSIGGSSSRPPNEYCYFNASNNYTANMTTIKYFSVGKASNSYTVGTDEVKQGLFAMFTEASDAADKVGRAQYTPPYSV